MIYLISFGDKFNLNVILGAITFYLTEDIVTPPTKEVLNTILNKGNTAFKNGKDKDTKDYMVGLDVNQVKVLWYSLQLLPSLTLVPPAWFGSMSALQMNLAKILDENGLVPVVPSVTEDKSSLSSTHQDENQLDFHNK